ncbi:MAG: M48 family metalloprotease [Nitriliruptoraceae bacterium]
MDPGVLVSLPLESVAVRAALATVVTVLLGRALLRTGLRSPRARVGAAMAPAVALALVLVLSGTGLRLPVVMFPASGTDALAVPVGDGFLEFAPIAVPLLVGGWALIALWRVSRRLREALAFRFAVRRSIAAGLPDPDLDALAARTAAALDVPTPTVAKLAHCQGGAYVVGRQHPVVVLDASLVDTLDREELEGVLAHELAHVRRRDTLVAQSLGLLRDLTFFVPGGGWAIRQLHRERELAADQRAVGATGRPGALASGLLKVLERGTVRCDACAALVPSSSVVERVRMLVGDQRMPSPWRRRTELAAVVVATGLAVTSAILVPASLAGPERERDAVALVWSSVAPAEASTFSDREARAFEVYRGSDLDVAETSTARHSVLDEHSQEDRRAALHACATDGAGCPVPDRSPSLGLEPRSVTVDDVAAARWKATPVGDAEPDGSFRMYWLARAVG